MLIKLLKKSFARRRQRVILTIIAIMMGSAITSALFTISSNINEKLSREFRLFGSNIIVTPKSETIEVGLPGINFGSVTEQYYIKESDLWMIKEINNWSANILGYAPFLYQVVKLNTLDQSQNVVLAGTYFTHPESEIILKNGSEWVTGIRYSAPFWQVDGNWIENDTDTKNALIGTTIAQKMNLQLYDTFSVNYTDPITLVNRTQTLTVYGIVSTGGADDAYVFVNLNVAQTLSNRTDKVHSVLVSALCNNCPAEVIAAEIETKIPYIQAKSVKQLVRAETQIMMQVQQMLILITVIGLLASALSVMTIMMSSVMERKKEIGIMKAIGADDKQIAALFLFEAGFLGLIGGVVGFVLGYFLAQIIAQQIFSTFILPDWGSLPIILAISIGVAIIGSLFPIRRAVRIEPMVILRGD